jgi:Ca2+:H+ antiporter
MVVPSTSHRFLGGPAPGPAAALDGGVAVVLLTAYALYLVFMLRTHPEFFASAKAAETDRGARRSLAWAGGTLLAASLGAAWMSEILVGAAEATGHALGMSPLFIGIVLLAVLGGAAESGTAIAMARKGQMDLSVGIAMGSCLQIALFVTPVLVLSSRMMMPEPLTLSFSRLEIGALFLGGADRRDRRGRRPVKLVQGRPARRELSHPGAMFYLIPAETARTLARSP